MITVLGRQLMLQMYARDTDTSLEDTASPLHTELCLRVLEIASLLNGLVYELYAAIRTVTSLVVLVAAKIGLHRADQSFGIAHWFYATLIWVNH
jgi:hypothetical protein